MAFTPEDIADLRRWAISGALVVLAYGAIGAAMVTWRDPVESEEVTGAIIIEFAPVLAAPELRAEQLPPGPEMEMSDPSRKIDSPEEKPVEVEQKVEVKVAQKVEEKIESKPVEEPPPEVAPAPDPEVAVMPPPPQELKQEMPRREEPRPAAPATSAPHIVPDEVRTVAVAPTPDPMPRNSPGLKNWIARISTALERHKRYPPQSEARREQGTAQVRFSLDRQGRVIESEIVQSSGAAALVEQALALLQRAPPCATWSRPAVAGGRMVLTVPVRFNLKR